MPLRPLRPCTYPGCHTLSRTGRCEKHPKVAWETRKSSGRGGSKWRSRRERIFHRDKFLCQRHLQRGELVAVTLHGPDHGICDHIVPLAEGGTDDESNLQTICQACDREKTQAEATRGAAGARG